MARFLLADGSFLLNILGDNLLLETGVDSANSITFSCAELLGLDHQCNFWGDAFNYSNTHTLSIKGRVTGSYENVSGVWEGMSGLIAYTSGNRLITINGVDIGSGRITALSFDQGTDVGFKTYSATLEIPRHAGSGMYSGSGYLPATGTFYNSNGANIVSFFTSNTGKYIKNFSQSSSTEVVGSGKFNKNKEISFSLDKAIYDDFGVSPNVYAARMMEAAQNSYGDIEILTAFHPDYYKNGSGISYTSQNYDTDNYVYSFSERFNFETGLPYIWSYNHSLNLADSIISVEEKGTITSSQLSGFKMATASGGWNTVQTGIFGRVSGLYVAYTGSIGYSGGCGLFNQPERSSLSRDSYVGRIDYAQTYSNSPFTSSGYSFSYTDEVSVDEAGYITVSENGQLKAFRNIRPSGFNLVYTGFLQRSGEIYSRITGLYAASTGALRSCHVSGGLNFDSSKNVFREYDAEISYDWSYSDNPNLQQTALFYRVDSTTSNELPTHIHNYFPISYSTIIAQAASQSTRGVFTNSISMIGKENTKLNDFVTGARSYIQKPSGTDIYATDYSYEYNPLENTFSMDLVYNYTLHRAAADYLI